MKIVKVKFILSILMLILFLFLVKFNDNYLDLLYVYIMPTIYILFIIDSLTVLIPKINYDNYSKLHQIENYTLRHNYDESIMLKGLIKANYRALFVFIIYFGFLLFIGIWFLISEHITKDYIIIAFLLLNTADYLAILYWCPFQKIFLTNKCCLTCRISNWDRLMKFFILVFIPNAFTITLFILGLAIFIQWEVAHHLHPERFYQISNKGIACSNCIETHCKKKGL